MTDKMVALFVAKDSIYKNLIADCYDEEKDALTYNGDFPIIAHPPCQLWGKMAKINYMRWGGLHNKPGNDGGKFKFALDTVERCGGIIEHPAMSNAFIYYGIGKPVLGAWTRARNGWVCEVWQSAYGHRANKKTWLYYVGLHRPKNPDFSTPRGACQIGFHDQRGKERNKPTLGKHEANATPLAFAEYLIDTVLTGMGLI